MPGRRSPKLFRSRSHMDLNLSDSSDEEYYLTPYRRRCSISADRQRNRRSLSSDIPHNFSLSSEDEDDLQSASSDAESAYGATQTKSAVQSSDAAGPSSGTGAAAAAESNSRCSSSTAGASSSSQNSSSPGSSSTAGTSSESQNSSSGSASSTNSSGNRKSMRERFNKHNDRVIPLKKCSELIVGVLYRIKSAARTNTKFGPSIRVEIEDVQSPTGNAFLFLPSRFRDLSNEDLDDINAQANTAEGIHLVYKGRLGRADMVELV